MLSPISGYQIETSKNYKLPFLLYFLGFLLLVYLFLHIPFEEAGSSKEVYFRYYNNFSGTERFSEIENSLKRDARKQREEGTESDQIILHTDIPSLNQIKVFFLDQSGLTATFNIPSRRGYLTYPRDGSFFIWYPVLGTKVRVFDYLGKFLWEIPESRYLQALEDDSGRILAFAGDESRVEFLKPDFSAVLDIEGFVLVSHQVNKFHSKELPYDACFGFLNGDVVLVNTLEKKKNRLSLGHPLKSMRCNFEEKYFLAQIQKNIRSEDISGSVKEKTVHKDFLLKVSFDSIPFGQRGFSDQFKANSEFALPQSYPFSLPIHWLGEDIMVILPGEDLRIEILIANEEGEIKTTLEWPQKFVNSTELENFRIEDLNDLLAISTDTTLIILSQEKMNFRHDFNNITRIAYINNLLLVQTEKGILAFGISKNS